MDFNQENTFLHLFLPTAKIYCIIYNEAFQYYFSYHHMMIYLNCIEKAICSIGSMILESK